MRPMGKPKKGFEKRFNQIFNIISGKEKQELSIFDKLKGKKLKSNDELLQEWFANQIQSYETIRAPKVGRDKEADDWMKGKYDQSIHKMPLEEFMKENNGFYVIELAKETDGVPVYKSFGQDENVLRGEFLRDCVDLIGKELVAEAWGTKLADETLDYGLRLLNTADTIAKENNLEFLRTQRMPPDSEENNVANKLHIVYAVAKWLIFYGKNGHGYEADF